MACLQILHPDGTTITEVLNEREPVTVGRHTSNTIVVNDASLPMLYARVLWNKKASGFEITSASGEDLTISGQKVRSAVLQPGDLLQVGPLTIIYRPEVPLPDADMATKDYRDSPLNDPEFVQALLPEPSAGQEMLEPEEEFSVPDSKKKRKSRHKTQTSPAEAVTLVPAASEPETVESVGEWLTKARRPGERDALRSPLITAMAFVGFCLLVAIGALMLLIVRQSAKADFAAAQADREAGRFPQAIHRYEQFLNEYPTSSLASQARSELSLTYIDETLNSSPIDYPAAMQAIEQFVNQHRQQENFTRWYPQLTRYAFQLATSAYALASRRHDPAYLEPGDAARLLFARFKASDGSDDQQQLRIEEASRQARADLLEFDVKQQTLTLMDQQLQQNAISAALASYRLAVVRYPQFARQPEFVSRLKQGLTAELAQVQSAPAQSTPASRPETSASSTQWNVGETYLIERNLSRLEIRPDGQPAWMLADGTCLAFERLTGQPLWKLEIGRSIPFEPMALTVRTPCWLMPMGNGQQLALVERQTGQLIWQTNLPAPCITRPTLTDSLIYLVTADQRLSAIEVETGQTVTSMTFPRPITAPVSLLDENQLLLVAEKDVFYLVNRRDWTCQSVRYAGQAPGTIIAAPLLLGENLIVIENDQLKSSRLCLYSLDSSDWDMTLTHSERLPGIAVNAPVIWGDRLFLETYGARIAVWQLSDQKGELPFKRLTVAPLPFSEQTRLFLAPIEGDRLLVAGEGLRELTLLTNSFEQNALPVTLGQTTQSLQTFGTQLVVAGEASPRAGYSVLHFDSERQESYWKNLLGSDPLLLLADPDQPEMFRCLTAQGSLFHVTRDHEQHNLRWSDSLESLFESTARTAGTTVSVGSSPSSATGQSVVSLGNQIQILNRQGASEHKLTLSAVPQLSPQLTPAGLFWADKRGVHLTRLPGSDLPAVASWTLPVSAEAGTSPAIRWDALESQDETSFLGLYNRSRLMRWRLQDEGGLYLADAGSLDLPDPVAGPGLLLADLYYLATQAGQLLTIDGQSLVIRSQTDLPGQPTAGPWQAGGLMLIELDGQSLIAIDPATHTQRVWELPLGNSPLAVPPLLSENGQLICGQRNGRLLLLDPASGQQITELQLAAPLSCPPLSWQKSLYCGLTNGTVVKLLGPTSQVQE